QQPRLPSLPFRYRPRLPPGVAEGRARAAPGLGGHGRGGDGGCHRRRCDAEHARHRHHRADCADVRLARRPGHQLPRRRPLHLRRPHRQRAARHGAAPGARRGIAKGTIGAAARAARGGPRPQLPLLALQHRPQRRRAGQARLRRRRSRTGAEDGPRHGRTHRAAAAHRRLRGSPGERRPALRAVRPGKLAHAMVIPRFAKVFVCSGHMIDKPDRSDERFPPRQEKAVQAWMAARLAEWGAGPGDLAVCGGARGADLLFAELCAERGTEVWLMLPLPEAKFLDESVRLPGTDWEDRYRRLKERPGVKVLLQPERLDEAPAGADVFARNNLWMLDTARVEADDVKNLYALLVWDGEPTGDGPGGTSDFVARVEALEDLGGHCECVHPLK